MKHFFDNSNSMNKVDVLLGRQIETGGHESFYIEWKMRHNNRTYDPEIMSLLLIIWELLYYCGNQSMQQLKWNEHTFWKVQFSKKNKWNPSSPVSVNEIKYLLKLVSNHNPVWVVSAKHSVKCLRKNKYCRVQTLRAEKEHLTTTFQMTSVTW